MNDLEVCWWPIEKPIPYARNSRKIPQRAVDKVAASIQEFGWRVPIVVGKDGARIETSPGARQCPAFRVAPFTGAWI
jgi:hypothetical protein